MTSMLIFAKAIIAAMPGKSIDWQDANLGKYRKRTKAHTASPIAQNANLLRQSVKNTARYFMDVGICPARPGNFAGPENH